MQMKFGNYHNLPVNTSEQKYLCHLTLVNAPFNTVSYYYTRSAALADANVVLEPGSPPNSWLVSWIDLTSIVFMPVLGSLLFKSN